LQYQNGKYANVLDIIKIPLVEAKPHGHQTENHLISPDYYWTKQSEATWAQIVDATGCHWMPLTL
jgi:hypothetical protein